jgi:hypothetical protein
MAKIGQVVDDAGAGLVVLAPVAARASAGS